jgi:glycosyltransferase involved in cell wall biosynthesis
VAGDAALLVDPFDQAAIGNGLVRLIKNADYRTELRVKGVDRAAAFSWKNTARLTLQAYERAARTPGLAQ